MPQLLLINLFIYTINEFLFVIMNGWILGIEPKLITPQTIVLPLNYIHLREQKVINIIRFFLFNKKQSILNIT